MRNRRTIRGGGGDDDVVVRECDKAISYWRQVYMRKPLVWWPALRPHEAVEADPDGWADYVDMLGLLDRFST